MSKPILMVHAESPHANDLQILTSSYIPVADSMASVPIGISGYSHATDNLKVHYKQLLLIEGIHYSVSGDSTAISFIDWDIKAGSRIDFEVVRVVLS